jgi:DNA-binding transcriptional MerR regulator
MDRDGDDSGLKISALVHESGVSRELIHHYLREGLLPRPVRRAHYQQRHLKLLRLIKRLREERFLPLPVIREIVRFNGYDPDPIELVLLSGSEMTAAASAWPASAAVQSGSLSPDDLCARTGCARGRLEQLVSLGLVRPSGDGDRRRFGRHDANVVALVERGVALGVPLDSFRTIRAYVEVAFELEHALFLPADIGGADPEALARDLAVRKEIANGFVVNVLSGLIDGRLGLVLEESARKAREAPGLLFVPSEAFGRKHGLGSGTERLRAELGRRPRSARLALRLARAYFLAGRFREAAFVCERALAARSATRALERVLGCALVLEGETGRGVELLGRLREADGADALVLAYLALGHLRSLDRAPRVEAALRAVRQVSGLVDDALRAAERAPPAERAEASLVAGWILASLPALAADPPRGLRAIEAAYEACSRDAPEPIEPEVERLRLRITGARLLLRALGAAPRQRSRQRLLARRRAELRVEILTIDPASAFALEVYLDDEKQEGPDDAVSH